MPQRHYTSLDLPEQAAPGNPASGRRRLYFKTDGKLYQRNSTGTETEVGGGGSATLAGLTDTSISSPATNQVLKWNGSVWINAALGTTDIASLFDSTNPAALGTAAPGSATVAARRDHVHPMPNIFDGTLPAALGTAATGSAAVAARRDHVHAMPTAANVGAPPTSRAVNTGTGLTGGGNLTADRTLSISYDATVPAALGTAATGSAAAPARRDHVHAMPTATQVGAAPENATPGFPCDVATGGNITLSGHQTIDGVTTTENMVVLVKVQAANTQNGVYLAKSGAWTRHPLFSTPASLAGAIVRVTGGTNGGGSIWKCTFSTSSTIGTDAVMWWPIVDRLGLDLTYAAPSQAEAEAGTATTTRFWTAQRVHQAAKMAGAVVCTSTTRPAGAVEGTEIFETDTGRMYLRSGGQWYYVGGGLDPTLLQARMTKTTGQTVTNNTGTYISWQTVDYDNGSAADLTDNGFQVPWEGKFSVDAGVQWASIATGTNVAITIAVTIGSTTYKRSSNVIQGSASANNRVNQSKVSWTGYLPAGAFIELEAFQHTGSGLTAQSSGNTGDNPGTFFEIDQVA